MNCIVIGSGGREHTLGWKLAQSNLIEKLFFIPGNGGTTKTGININIDINNFEEVEKFILENETKLIVIGPEQPLVGGLVDYLEKKLPKEYTIVGPSQKGAMLEGSKIFAKNFMKKYSIPTAKFGAFNKDEIEKAIDFLKTLTPPYVIKADGLAAGKGVLIIDSFEAAAESLREMFSGKFGESSKNVVIEQFLTGIELSVFVLTDGENYIILPTSKDYKRIGEGDTGLNTGGMGAVSPVPFATPEFMTKVEEKIIKPTIKGLQKEKISYKGFIYFGLMKVGDEPYVIEYNARMGDPETQAVIPRIKNDLAELFLSIKDKSLNKHKLETIDKIAVTVVLASKGYPEKYEKNKTITIENFNENILNFHAGTKITDNKLVTSGGRVMAITCFGSDIEDARKNVYNSIKLFNFDRMYFRKDIGIDLMNFNN